MFKKIGHEYYREELFVVKSETRYNCASTIYFNCGIRHHKRKL